MATRDKPEEPLAYDEEKLPQGYVSYSVTQVMKEPTDSHHVRGVAIYIPHLHEVPSLSVRIIADERASPVMITSVKINENVGGYMQIAVAVQTLPPPPGAPPPQPTPVIGVHYCNIVAIGRPVANK